MDFDRQVPLEGCFNFRDLGAYVTADGRRIRSRRLFRADGPHALTAADELALASLGLVTIIDLRTPEEAEERGGYDAVVPDVTVHSLPLVDVLPEHSDLERWVDPAIVAARYRTMLDGASAAIAEVLAILSEPSAHPAVFHCSAGKDRTGILAALVLGLLDVPDETIVADYALSGAAMTKLIAHLHERHPDSSAVLEQIAPAMVAAEPETMTRLLAGIRADFGSLEAYAATLGVPEASSALRAALLTR
jgi:protein-tyrosine phosphatase